MDAVYGNDLPQVSALLAEGTHPDFLYVDTTPLHEAIRQNNFSMVKALVDAGADVNRRAMQSFHDFPLDVADGTGEQELIEYLEDKGAQSSLPARLGHRQRALFDAVVENDAEKVVQILKSGIDPDFMVEGEVTPLDEAISRQNETIVRELVSAGADVNRVNAQQTAPLDVAEVAGDEAITAYLKSEGAVSGLLPVSAQQDLQRKPVFREDTLKDIFAARHWAGRTKEMEDLWQGVPKRLKESFDFAAALAEARQQTLKQKAGKFSLAPKPNPPR